MSEPITNYRRVRTMEGWAPLDDLSTELTPCAPGDRGRINSTWVVYNHARREYVSGTPWPREASVDDKSEALRRAMRLLTVAWVNMNCWGRENVTATARALGGPRETANWGDVKRWVLGEDQGELWDQNRMVFVEREASVPDEKIDTASRDLQELRAEVAQLHQEVEFWTKGASTWRERALEYWDAGGEKQEEELVQRVARWAHEEARHQALKSWEELPSSAQEQWLSRARAAIEGER